MHSAAQGARVKVPVEPFCAEARQTRFVVLIMDIYHSDLHCAVKTFIVLVTLGSIIIHTLTHYYFDTLRESIFFRDGYLRKIPFGGVERESKEINVG